MKHSLFLFLFSLNADCTALVQYSRGHMSCFTVEGGGDVDVGSCYHCAAVTIVASKDFSWAFVVVCATCIYST